ncbi:MAG TPA: phage major capsid protein, partial [Gemmatimonadales bacterium]
MKTRKQFPGQSGAQYRECPIRRLEARADATDSEPRYEIAVSSEYEVERYSYFGMYREVLDHGKGAVQLSRFRSGRAPVLLDHETRDQVGVIESARVDEDNVLRAVIRFGQSARAQEIRADVEGGIRGNISVGYFPKRWKLVEEDSEKGDLWRSTLWEPLEASIVPVPADPTVGVGRANGPGWRAPVETEEDSPMRLKKVLDERGAVIDVPENDPRQELTDVQVRSLTGAAAPPAVTVERNGGGAPKRDRNAEIAEILRLCKSRGVEVKDEWIASDLTADQVARKVLEEMATRAVAQPGSERGVEIPDRDVSKYSYARAIQIGAGLHARGGDGIEVKPSGLEWEMHREIEKRLPERYAGHGGIFVPTRLGVSAHKRALDSLTATKGAETVFDQPGELIELFRNRALVGRFGARFLSGLTGPVAFSKQTGGMTMHWIGENPASGVSPSDIALGLVTLNPKTVMGTTSYSRQLLVMAPSSGIEVESLVRDEFSIGHGLEIDRVCLHGTGTSGEPLGIFNMPGTLASDIATPSWGEIVSTQGKVAGVNVPIEGLGFMTTPEYAAKLMATQKVSGQAIML